MTNKSVKVIFANPKYNYTTSVSNTATDESLKNYFINTPFDMGAFPREDFQTCIGIEINNKSN